ncbi:OLC1v1009065C2 [Oldenlandia corymbosa var. corymbosa]|nr:OLC1v1009065C2 [Oldenlandia corymbosa var. corymbosa]
MKISRLNLLLIAILISCLLVVTHGKDEISTNEMVVASTPTNPTKMGKAGCDEEGSNGEKCKDGSERSGIISGSEDHNGLEVEDYIYTQSLP